MPNMAVVVAPGTETDKRKLLEQACDVSLGKHELSPAGRGSTSPQFTETPYKAAIETAVRKRSE